MRIKVTDQHIADGVRQDCFSCPVALAVKESLGLARGVIVTRHTIYIDGELFCPERGVFAFVRAFDDFQSVAPFEFDLDYPKGEQPCSD